MAGSSSKPARYLSPTSTHDSEFSGQSQRLSGSFPQCSPIDRQDALWPRVRKPSGAHSQVVEELGKLNQDIKKEPRGRISPDQTKKKQKIDKEHWDEAIAPVVKGFADLGIEILRERDEIGKGGISGDPLDYSKWYVVEDDWIYPVVPCVQPKASNVRDHWKRCSTNIHFSLDPHEKIPLDKAKRIAMAAIYFEPAIDDLMVALPATGKDKDKFRPGGWKRAEEWTSSNVQETIEDLAKLVCLNIGRRGGDPYRKNYKWNFSGLKFKTIEFRQMPPIMDREAPVDWVNFTMAFVKSAIAVDPNSLDADASIPSVDIDGSRKAFAASYGLTSAPSNKADLEKFLDGQGLDPEFWKRMRERKTKLQNDMTGPETLQSRQRK
ncbi:Uu.00g105110.m01.CDS01 [Anthostomella pinea]|uniref:Uu.00g105110.m01.CDS01 n=1 Tax=Anthostomella pinea TaxID=933095 RepID=A0AAI8YFR7_9PEZI|nr:Uu.00g105110.m01.CDS01 [Anthostomella pinea]